MSRPQQSYGLSIFATFANGSHDEWHDVRIAEESTEGEFLILDRADGTRICLNRSALLLFMIKAPPPGFRRAEGEGSPGAENP